MGAHDINVLLSTFAGLDIPRTLSIQVADSATVHDTLNTIYDRLPTVDQNFVITTTSNKQLCRSNEGALSTLLSSSRDTFLPLRLSVRTCGGKGGFGSQLRAAGGRMSSRKKRNQNNEPTNGSNRNLDGRRLRTVDAAKKLAHYLAEKPEMEKKERETKRERWEQVVKAADQREEEIKSGKLAASQGRLDAEYVEGKELAEDKTREAVIRAMREVAHENPRTGSESSLDDDGEESEDESEEHSSGSSEDEKMETQESSGPTFFGWDDDDDDDHDDDEDEDGEELEQEALVTPPEPAYEGKGKAKAT